MKPRPGLPGALALAVLVALLLGAPACAPPPSEPPGESADSASPAGGEAGYRAEIERRRAEREEELRAETGWLSLIGLFWLERGENRIGSGPDDEIRLPADAAPVDAGTIRYDGKTARLFPAAGAGIAREGKPIGELELNEDEELTLGRLHFYLIERSGRLAIRVKDPESPVRKQFHGLQYFPIDPAWRAEARLVRYEPPHELEVATVVGDPTRFHVPGRLEFELAGESVSLEALTSGPGDTDLFLIFKDATSGNETYGAGRYLHADLEPGDRAVVDFNLAYNPPCAFTPFATCPLPPPGNRLDFAVTAGEKAFGAPH